MAPLGGAPRHLPLVSCGYVGYRISRRLSDAGVPTSRQIWGHPNAGKDWAPATIYEMLADPLNEGIATSFRTEMQEQRPDAKHKTVWKKQVDIPFEKQIPIKGAIAEDAVILTHTEAELVRKLLAQGKKGSLRRAQGPVNAMLLGGMALCGMPRLDDPSQECLGTLRLKRAGHGDAMCYVCSRHDQRPHMCAGISSLHVLQLDTLVWQQVFEKLVFSDQLEAQAAQQAQLDTNQDDPASELRRYEAIRKDQERKKANYIQSIGDVKDADSRADLNRSLDRCNELIRDADAHIAALSEATEDHAYRHAVLTNVMYQAGRHLHRLLELEPVYEDD